MARARWLVKSEPSSYGWDRLVKEKRTLWTGVRNFTARNHLAAMKKGDLVLYYHSGEGREVVGVARITGQEVVIAATRDARAMLCRADEINFLSGPGRGVILIKLQNDDDRVLGFIASVGDRDLMTVETTRGAEQTISTAKYEVSGRGGKGRELLQRGQFTRVIPTLPEMPLIV